MDNKNNNADISAEELLRKLKENLDMGPIVPDLGSIALPDEPEEYKPADLPSAEDIIRARSLKKAALDQLEDEPADAPEADASPAADTAEVPAVVTAEVPVVETAEVPEAEYDTAPDSADDDFVKTAEVGVQKTDTAEFIKADTAEIPAAPEPAAPAAIVSGFNTAEFDTDAAEPVPEAFAEALNAPVEPAKPITREVETQSGEPESSDEPISDEAVDNLMRQYLSGSEYDAVSRQREEESDLVRHISDAEQYVSAIESAKQADEPREPLTETEKVIKEMDLSEIETGDSLDEVDVNLMIAFGMEKELAEKLGEEKIQDVKNALDADAEQLSFTRSDRESLSTELPDDMEYISQSQMKEVFRVYRRKQRRIILRFFGCAVMTLLLFIFENFTAFGGSFDGTWLDPTVFPAVHSMISLQLCFFVMAFACKGLLSGLRALVTFRPTAKSIPAMMALFTIIYHAAVCFLYDGSRVLFCTFPLAVSVLIMIIGEYMSLKRDIYSFNIISSKRIKYVISEIPVSEESLEAAAFADYIDEDSSVSRVSKTSFVDGFFRRTKESTRGIPVLRALFPLPIAIAIFFFVFSAFVRHDAYLGLTSAYISLMLSTPISVLLVFAAPFYRASKLAYEQGGAIIGEDSLEEYSDVAAISFDDKDVFPSNGVKIQSIKIYGNNRIDRIIYNIASLFKHLGGPLSDVYSIATKDFDCSDDVEIVDIADDGIEAVISGKRIFLGRESFLLRNNFSPVLDMDDRAVEAAGDASITFLVTNDEVAAKIYTHYSIDPGFAAIARQLYRAGMCLGIKTFDPGIDDELLSHFIDLSHYPVKVIKCHSTADTLRTEEKADSGIVSKKNARSLLKTLSLCEKVNSSSKTGMFIVMISVIIAFAISAFLLFKGLSSNITGIYVTLYQLFWIIPAVIIERLNVTR